APPDPALGVLHDRGAADRPDRPRGDYRGGSPGRGLLLPPPENPRRRVRDRALPASPGNRDEFVFHAPDLDGGPLPLVPDDRIVVGAGRGRRAALWEASWGGREGSLAAGSKRARRGGGPRDRPLFLPDRRADLHLDEPRGAMERRPPEGAPPRRIGT